MRFLIKHILCMFCSITLLFSLSAISAAAEESPWIRAYRAALDDFLEELSTQDGYSRAPDCWYLVYDIDKDGTPEMIIKYGSSEADYRGQIFTFRNGEAAAAGDNLLLGHYDFYSYPDSNGIILFHAHMGSDWATVIHLEEDGSCSTEELYQDDLNSRMLSEPGAMHIYPGGVISGSVSLTFCPAELSLPLTHYAEIGRCLSGDLPPSDTAAFPAQDEHFFERLTTENGEVFAVTADGYTNSPGAVSFARLLEEDVVAPYMKAGLELLDLSYGDLNADGQMEALALMGGDIRNDGKMYCVLSEQGGQVYAYLSCMEFEIADDGCLLHIAAWYEQPPRYRLIFDGPEAFLLRMPD